MLKTKADRKNAIIFAKVILSWALAAWCISLQAQDNPDTQAENTLIENTASGNSADENSELAAQAGTGEEPRTVKEKGDKSRVFSCSVYFEVNSVKFNPERIKECFNGIDIERISYVHVIATASTDGSMSHNLYLSNRRAGSLEGFINNQYPDVLVHAFGGGENPKFGKSARIIIVESAPAPNSDKLGQVQAIVQKPETKVIYKTKIETKVIEKRPPNLGIRPSVKMGYSIYKPESDKYQYVGAAAKKRLFTLGARQTFFAGLEYGVHRANPVQDIHEAKISFSDVVKIMPLIQGNLSLELGANAGGLRSTKSVTDFGADLFLFYEKDNWSTGIGVMASKNIQLSGMKIGVML